MNFGRDHHSRTPCKYSDVESIAADLNKMSDAGRKVGLLVPRLDEAADMLRKLCDIIDAKNIAATNEGKG